MVAVFTRSEQQCSLYLLGVNEQGATLERCRHVVNELSCADAVLYTATSQFMNKGVHVQIFCF